jgi:hypothetical protein
MNKAETGSRLRTLKVEYREGLESEFSNLSKEALTDSSGKEALRRPEPKPKAKPVAKPKAKPNKVVYVSIPKELSPLEKWKQKNIIDKKITMNAIKKQEITVKKRKKTFDKDVRNKRNRRNYEREVDKLILLKEEYEKQNPKNITGKKITEEALEKQKRKVYKAQNIYEDDKKNETNKKNFYKEIDKYNVLLQKKRGQEQKKVKLPPYPYEKFVRDMEAKDSYALREIYNEAKPEYDKDGRLVSFIQDWDTNNTKKERTFITYHNFGRTLLSGYRPFSFYMLNFGRKRREKPVDRDVLIGLKGLLKSKTERWFPDTIGLMTTNKQRREKKKAKEISDAEDKVIDKYYKKFKNKKITRKEKEDAWDNLKFIRSNLTDNRGGLSHKDKLNKELLDANGKFLALNKIFEEQNPRTKKMRTINI